MAHYSSSITHDPIHWPTVSSGEPGSAFCPAPAYYPATRLS